MYERPIPRGWWELFPTGYPWANGSALCRLEGKKKRRDGQIIAYYEFKSLNKTNANIEKGMVSGKSEINDKQNENAAHCLQDLGNQVLHAPFQIQLPDSKVHGANMGPTWVLSAPDGPHEPCFQGVYSTKYARSFAVPCYVVAISSVLWIHVMHLPIIFRVVHDNVIKWKHFPRYWPFVKGVHR